MERRAKETPSFTKPMGKPGDERKFSKDGKATREEPYQGPSKGGWHNVGKKAKSTPSNGDERVRSKPDLGKFDREEPYQGPSKGGYNNVGKKAKETPSDGKERSESSYKKKSPFRNG